MKSRLDLLRKKSYSYDSCPTCGSSDLIKIDEYNHPTGWLEVYECQSCGSLIEKIID